MIRAIFFDLDNTLVDREGAHRRYCQDFVGRFLADLSASERSRAVEEMVERSAWGYADPNEYGDWIASRFPPTGLSGEAFLNDYRAHLPAFFEYDPRVVDIVDRLAAKFELAVVSNGSSTNQRRKIQRAQLADRFRHVIISGEVGIEKPAPEIFRQALTSVGCEPAEALFVGDDPLRDIAGAAAVGMTTLWISLGRQYPAGLQQPDQVVESLHAWKGP